MNNPSNIKIGLRQRVRWALGDKPLKTVWKFIWVSLVLLVVLATFLGPVLSIFLNVY